MNNFPLRILLANVRSTANVGSIFRTADALGVELIYACGYTPYPEIAHDARPPHVRRANTTSISKTSLGAEQTVPVLPVEDTQTAITQARNEGYTIIALEQSPDSIPLHSYTLASPTAIILGNEVTGIADQVLRQTDVIIEIPMLGRKESYGVAVAAGIALYSLRSS
jgi:tRNA G18 (ribose-2'-O)-methylase SpoU